MSLAQSAKENILTYITEEELSPGVALPTEAAFMEMLGVSRHTVREALILLEQERLIYRVQGKGTFLKRKPQQIESGIEKLESITDIIRSFGLEPRTKMVKIEVQDPTPDMVRRLDLPRGEKMVTFKRVRSAQGAPAADRTPGVDEEFIAYCVDSMPLSLFPSFPTEIEEESMFQYLAHHCGVVIERAVTTISPTRATYEMVSELGVEQDRLLLLLHQIHYDNRGRPVIYSNDYFDTHFIQFKINRLRP